MLKLARLNLSSYEWRVLMVLLAELYAENRQAISISLDFFVKKTGIKKPHVVRALNKLEERCVITRLAYKRDTSYAFQGDPSRWKSLLTSQQANGKPVGMLLKRSFNNWYEKYPNPMHEADAEAIYVELVNSGEATEQELDDALEGYINHELHRAKKFNQKPDPWYCMYPTSFLRGRWKEYIQYKNKKPAPRL